MLIVGIVIGIFCGRYLVLKNTSGSLRVDQSDPDSGPYLFLELSDSGAEMIYTKRYIILKINLDSYISQK